MVFNLPLLYANPIPTDGPPVPQGYTHGLGAQAQETPIDDYALLLGISGIVLATGMFYYRNNIQVKTK